MKVQPQYSEEYWLNRFAKGEISRSECENQIRILRDKDRRVLNPKGVIDFMQKNGMELAE